MKQETKKVGKLKQEPQCNLETLRIEFPMQI